MAFTFEYESTKRQEIRRKADYPEKTPQGVFLRLPVNKSHN
jgi:hypothetical protein